MTEPTIIARIVKRRMAGASLTMIAAEFDISYSTVRRTIARYEAETGISITPERSIGADGKSRPARYTAFAAVSEAEAQGRAVGNPFDPETEEFAEWARQGAALLDEVRAALVKYVIFPTAAAADAVTLWVTATHAQPSWEHASRLVVKSPIKRCGKTRLQEIVTHLVHRPLRTTNISVAALVRSIEEKDPPTIILDEADAIFATRRGQRTENAEDLRGILNAGHSRGWSYIRWNPTAHHTEEWPTFAMALVAAIGDLPDTIEDRAVIISMRRRGPGESVAQYRNRHVRDPLRDLHERLHAWVGEHLERLRDAEPELPVEDREADVWEPLVAVAEAAGGDWPSRARAACTSLTTPAVSDPDTAGERLLADLRVVFRDAECLYTTTIIEKLCKIDDAPWSEWYGKEITARQLAALLKPWGVESRDVREGGTGRNLKGYYAADLHDPWQRYVRDKRDKRDTGEFVQVKPVADAAATSATDPRHESPQVSALWDTGVAHVADVADSFSTCVHCGCVMDAVLVADGLTGHPGCEPIQAEKVDQP